MQQHYQRTATFLGRTLMLADLQLAEKLYKIWNRKALQQPALMTETEEKMSQNSFLSHSVQCWAQLIATVGYSAQCICICASVCTFTSGLWLLLQ